MQCQEVETLLIPDPKQNSLFFIPGMLSANYLTAVYQPLFLIKEVLAMEAKKGTLTGESLEAEDINSWC